MPILQMPLSGVGDSGGNQYQKLYNYDNSFINEIKCYFGEEIHLNEEVQSNWGSTIIDNILYYKCANSASNTRIHMYNIKDDTASDVDINMSTNKLYRKFIVGHTSDNELCMCEYNSSSRLYEMIVIDLKTKEMTKYTYPGLSANNGGMCVDNRTNTVYIINIILPSSIYYENVYSRSLTDTTSAWTSLTQCGSVSNNSVGELCNLTFKEKNNLIYWVSLTSNSNQIRVNCYDIKTNKFREVTSISNMPLSIYGRFQPLVSVKEDGSEFVAVCYTYNSFIYRYIKNKDGTFSKILINASDYYRYAVTFPIDDNICLCSRLNVNTNIPYLSKAYSGLIYLLPYYVSVYSYKTFISAGNKICTVSGVDNYFYIIVDMKTGEFNFMSKNQIGNNLLMGQMSVGIMETTPLYTTKNDTLVMVYGVDLIITQ